MITLHIGGVPFQVDPQAIADSFGERIQEAMAFPGVEGAKAKVIKLGVKMLMREMLGAVERGIIKGQLAYPLPEWDVAERDVIGYGVAYMFAMITSDLERQEWDAEYTEGPHGEIIISGIIPAAAPLPADTIGGLLAGPDAGEADSPAGSVGATGYADSSPADGHSPTGGPQSTRGEGGGYLDAGGDEGDGEDDGGEGAHQIAVAVVP